MIKSGKAFDRRAKELIKQILENGVSPEYSDVDRQVLAFCVKQGYLRSKYLLSTEDGREHFELYENDCVTREGLDFIRFHVDWKFLIPLIVSLVALLKSFSP